MKNKILLFIILTFAIIKCNLLLAQDFSGTHFRNGDLIPYIESYQEWKSAGENKQPAWCFYNNDLANGPKYGKLYNWYAVVDPRGLCPVGWHVPSDAEWRTLITTLGGEKVAGYKMKSTNGWYENGNGKNTSGFSGLPGGYRGDISPNYYGPNEGSYGNLDVLGYFWSSTEIDADKAWYRLLIHDEVVVNRFDSYKYYGISVRCLRD